MEKGLNWDAAPFKNLLKINNEEFSYDSEPENVEDLRKKIEPWLSAIFQSEHLSLLIGSGLSTSLTSMAGVETQAMGRLTLTNELNTKIREFSNASAVKLGRGEANLEDDLRTVLELIRGLNILQQDSAAALKTEVESKLLAFIKSVLKMESDFQDKISISDVRAISALIYLKTFLLSFSSRASSRERLNLFTTNYDRFIEYGLDDSGIIVLDRFRGKLYPIFRTTKLELDYHYNPPGIRGEPRYLEGVIKFFKLHGSIDWRFKDKQIIRSLLPFGAKDVATGVPHPELPKNPTEHVVIYPNSSKDIETSFYPYSELFRDFSSAVCRPNSVIVLYGYGFGDSHINRIIEDMLTIPSTHVVIISFDKAAGRIKSFFGNKNKAQFTLLIGNHFGDLKKLVDNYLPKSAIDRITYAMKNILDHRVQENNNQSPQSSAHAQAGSNGQAGAESQQNEN
jgi:hypothetical protein